MLEQIATWASEQCAFTDGERYAAQGQNPPRWAIESLRAGRVLAEALYVQVRLTALAKRDELPGAVLSNVAPDHPSRTGEWPAASQKETTRLEAEEAVQPENSSGDNDRPLPLRRHGRLREVDNAPAQGALL